MQAVTMYQVKDKQFKTVREAFNYCEDQRNLLAVKLFNEVVINCNGKYVQAIDFLMSEEAIAIYKQIDEWASLGVVGKDDDETDV